MIVCGLCLTLAVGVLAPIATDGTPAGAYNCAHLATTTARIAYNEGFWYYSDAAKNNNLTWWWTNGAPGYDWKCTDGGSTWNIYPDSNWGCYADSSFWTGSTYGIGNCYWYVDFWYYYVFISEVSARYGWYDPAAGFPGCKGCEGTYYLYADVSGDDGGRSDGLCYYQGNISRYSNLFCKKYQQY